MKNAVMLFTSVCIYSATIAQDQPKFMAGGNISFSSQKYNSLTDNQTINLTVRPTGGIMLNETIAVGLSVGLGHSKYKNQDPFSGGLTERTSTQYTFAPYLRIHKNITEQFKFYVQPETGFAFISQDGGSSKQREFYLGTNIGLLYFVSQRLSLEVSLADIAYINMWSVGSDFKNERFLISYSLTDPKLGVRYYF